MSVVAISHDGPEDTMPWARARGLSFAFASDRYQAVIQAWGLSPHFQEVPVHAAYVLDTDGRIFYAKVARRRPHARELLQAIDYHGCLPRPGVSRPNTRS